MSEIAFKRPSRDVYFLGIAVAVSMRSNCIRRRIGAVVVVGGRIVSSGYNGTPTGMRNCFDGGCKRCNSEAEQGNYEHCICVHAEENAIALAARHGTKVEGGTLYCTLRPCGDCLRLACQSGIVGVVFGEEWTDEQRDNLFTDDYELLTLRFPEGVQAK